MTSGANQLTLTSARIDSRPRAPLRFHTGYHGHCTGVLDVQAGLRVIPKGSLIGARKALVPLELPKASGAWRPGPLGDSCFQPGCERRHLRRVMEHPARQGKSPNTIGFIGSLSSRWRAVAGRSRAREST